MCGRAPATRPDSLFTTDRLIIGAEAPADKMRAVIEIYDSVSASFRNLTVKRCARLAAPPSFFLPRVLRTDPPRPGDTAGALFLTEHLSLVVRDAKRSETRFSN